MCGRYTLTTPGGKALTERFAVEDTFEQATLDRFSVCPTERIAVVCAEGEARVVHTVRWGLVPRGRWLGAAPSRSTPVGDAGARRPVRRRCSRAPTAAASCSPTAGTSGCAASTAAGTGAVPVHGGRRRPVRLRRAVVTPRGSPTSGRLGDCILTYDGQRRLRAGARPHAVRADGARRPRRRGWRPTSPSCSARAPGRAHHRRPGQPGREQGGRRRCRAARPVPPPPARRAAQPGHLTLRRLAGFPV